ncbi:MAG TPA: DUF6502 family protein [Albitalea sp.]|uniref:DUF6502 family protein n=1 Tax=Piscinibacter sp. TaxID=1903157 RepID=UPI002ED23148
MDFAPDTPATAGSAPKADDTLLLRACQPVMAPLARLAVARGMQYAQFDELMRSAFVEAAREAHPDVPPHRAVSRVSAATGINRREVSRLIKAETPEAPKRAPATELFARWLTDPTLRHRGAPRPTLPRQGAAPSFESLAQSVTKDVHPRSLLEELCRLGLTKVDESSDSVVLLRETFVPAGDDKRLFGFLGANVGDHLSAAVANVLGQTPRHLEQAMFADGLSRESLERLRPIVREQWQTLVRAIVPMVRQFIEEDEAAARPQDQRLRIGMYAYAESMNPDDAPAEPTTPESIQPARSRRGIA